MVNAARLREGKRRDCPPCVELKSLRTDTALKSERASGSNFQISRVSPSRSISRRSRDDCDLLARAPEPFSTMIRSHPAVRILSSCSSGF